MQVNPIKQFEFHFIWAMQCICSQSDNAIQSNINMSIETQFNSEYKISNKSRNPAPEYAACKPTLRLVIFRTRLPYRLYLKYTTIKVYLKYDYGLILIRSR